MQFDIHINYNILRKYNLDIEMQAQLLETRNESLSSVSHAFQTHHRSTTELKECLTQYAELLTTYNLSEHFEHLLFFAGSIMQGFEEAELDKMNIKTAKEALKNAVLLLKLYEENDFSKLSISVERKGFKEKVTFDQAIFIQAVIQPLVENIIRITHSPAFSPELHEVLKDCKPNYVSFKKALNSIKRSTSPDQYDTTLSRFCSTVVNYLNHETTLKSKPGTTLSSDQGRFLFQFLKLFSFIDEESISSNPEDYIGSKIRNREKKS